MSLNTVAFVFTFGMMLHKSFAGFQAEQTHCVQYHAWKTLFLFKKEEIFGTNCAIQSEIQKTEAGPVLKLEIPIEQFQSGNSSRDEDVKSILKYAEHPVMRFESEILNLPELKASVNSGSAVDIPGKLRIGGVQFPVGFQVRLSRQDGRILLRGTMTTTFTHFKIPPPQVLGGVVSSAEDRLELHVALSSEKLQGSAGLID
ncbi:MAG: YceI family protein [Bdellovibrionales bacterium]|nr:YceI family protein [Bdellovibrionales bacterium]